MIKLFFITFIFGLGLSFGLLSITYFKSITTNLDFNKNISINIPMGTPIKKVSQSLKDKGILEYKWTFYVYMKLNKLEGKIQAGDFIFKTPIGLKDLFSQLGNAQQKNIRIIIPEGSTVDDIDKILTKKSLIKSGEFIECAKSCKFPNYNFFFDGDIEGYLFPDTYFVPVKTFSSNSFAKRMFDNFQRKVLTKDFKEKYKKDGKTLKDIVIMASMIERESRYANEMKIISGILWKRIKVGMTLGVDATTRYYKKSKSGILTSQDFKNKNPYNTRINLGLPPTAISNPGINSLNASLNPEKSPYFYYLHGNDLEIHYGKTNDEHNLNKFKYLK